MQRKAQSRPVPKHASSDEDELRAALAKLRRLEKRGAFAQALREADRAWRTMPEHAATLAPILGRLLLQDGAEPAAALKLLIRAAELSPGAEREADLIEALISCDRAEVAVQRLGFALQAYACVPDGSLARAARRLAQHAPATLSGWAGLRPDLWLHAEFRTSQLRTRLELRTADGTVLERKVVQARKGLAMASLRVPDPAETQFLRLTVDGGPLLGGDRIFPLDFRPQAHSGAIGRRIEGQVRLGWCDELESTIELGDEAGGKRRLRTRGGRFQLDADKAGLGSRIDMRMLLPDGRTLDLPDSPLLFKPELDARLHALQTSRQHGVSPPRLIKRPPVDIIIPVYRGHEETLACIDAVCRTSGCDASNILVVDDASPDLALAADLDALAGSGRITLLRNPSNLGFSASVNRAMAVHPDHDAVLVNADALVFGDWLPRLRAAAYRAPRIATVTPFADDDSVAQYSDGRSDAGSAELAAQMDGYAREAFRGRSAELPVGVGFCMYLRRAAWQEVGELDAAVFGKGYGEESDWCMRARKRGWQHRLAADIFVHHAGGSSFGSRRMALLMRAHRLMELRHPGYHRFVQRFLKTDALHPFRRELDAHRLRSQSQPIVLLVMLALTGGVDRYVGERCRQLREQGKFPLLLRPHKIGPDACMLWSFEPRLPHLHYRMPDELKTLRSLLDTLPIESVELHHFLGLDQRLVRTALNLGAPYDVYLHDYSWICPRVTLMNETGRYCGEPDLASCERCIQRNGSDLMEEISVAALRRRSRRWLQGARRVIAPSQDVAQRFSRYVPGLGIAVEPLEPDIAIPPPPVRRRKGLVRVALLGAIGRHKGYRVLLQCARDAAQRRLDLEFVLIGYSEKDAPLLATGRVFVTGEYRDGEVPGLLRREQPDLIWLPSVWPETWCYTLSHALASGLPVVAYDIGAIAERMRASGVGELLPLDTKPRHINDELLQVAARRSGEQPLFV